MRDRSPSINLQHDCLDSSSSTDDMAVRYAPVQKTNGRDKESLNSDLTLRSQGLKLICQPKITPALYSPPLTAKPRSIQSFFEPYADRKFGLNEDSFVFDDNIKTTDEPIDEPGKPSTPPPTKQYPILPTLSPLKHPRAFNDAENLLRILPPAVIIRAKKRRPGKHPAESKVAVALVGATLTISQQKAEKDAMEVQNQNLEKHVSYKQWEIDQLKEQRLELDEECSRLERIVEDLISHINSNKNAEKPTDSVSNATPPYINSITPTNNNPATPESDIRDSSISPFLPTQWKDQTSHGTTYNSPAGSNPDSSNSAYNEPCPDSDPLLLPPTSIDQEPKDPAFTYDNEPLSSMRSEEAEEVEYEDMNDIDYVPSSDCDNNLSLSPPVAEQWPDTIAAHQERRGSMQTRAGSGHAPSPGSEHDETALTDEMIRSAQLGTRARRPPRV